MTPAPPIEAPTLQGPQPGRGTRTVTFDLWHTLIQLAPAAEDRYLERQEALLADLLRTSPEISDARDPVSPERAARDALAAASRRAGAGTGGPVGRVAEDAAERAGRRARPGEWERRVEAVVEDLAFEEVTGARDELADLRSRGYRIAVVSNLVGETGRSMRRVLERLGMARFVESWAFSDELPWAKPAPEIFWEALRSLGASPSDAAHVGDLASDVQGARAAGFRGVLLFRGARAYGDRYAALFRTDEVVDPPADGVLSEWSELSARLSELYGGTPPGPPSAGRRADR